MNETPVIIKLHPEPEEYVEAETAFLRAVGLCITQWAFVDRFLFRLFRRGLGAQTQRAAIIYYDQHSMSQKLRQVDALLNVLLAGEAQKELHEWWETLRKQINELLPTRNIVAHQPVRRLGTSDGKKAVYIYGIHIEPYQRYLKKQHKGMKGKDALVTEDLIAHSEKAEELAGELAVFAKKLARTFQD
jgi:hypothetical protein